MNTSAIPVIAIACLCIISVGVSASTLDSSIQTDPDDVIDLNWKQLPIGQHAGATIQREMHENRGRGLPASRAQSDGGSANAPIAGATNQLAQATHHVATELRGDGPDTDDPDLLALLRRVLAFTAVTALLAALAILGYRHTTRHRRTEPSTPADTDVDPQWPPADPATEIDRAWLTMIHRLDVDRPWVKTPAECAAAATDTGMDADAVHLLTDAFEEVRYGGAAVTDARKQRVQRGLERLDLDPTAGSS